MARFATGIDIGDHSIKIAVLEENKGLVRVRALVKKPSLGLRRGFIVDRDETVGALKNAVLTAEKTFGSRIKGAYLALSGGHLASSASDGQTISTRGDQEITDLDIERATTAAEAKLSDLANIRIHGVIPIAFKLDGKKIYGTPRGMKGVKLEVRALFIHSSLRSTQELLHVADSAGLSVYDALPSPLAESLVTLPKTQKMAGCVLANIGAEQTTIAVFEEGLPYLFETIDIGSQEITNDIALGLKVSLEDAEDIKTGRDPRVYAQKKLSEIIEARLSDIFELIDSHLKKIGRSELLPAGAVIIGGGAFIPRIDLFAQTYLNLPARVASPLFPQTIHLSKENEKEFAGSIVQDPSFAGAYGAAYYGLHPEKEERSWGHEALAQPIFGKLGSWLKNFLP